MTKIEMYMLYAVLILLTIISIVILAIAISDIPNYFNHSDYIRPGVSKNLEIIREAVLGPHIKYEFSKLLGLR